MLWSPAISYFLLLLQVAKYSCTRYCSCHQQQIDCSSKHLTSISNELLSECLQMRTLQDPTLTTDLNLANNQLQELPSQLVSDFLLNLVALDLSNNKINKVTQIQSVIHSKLLLNLTISLNPIYNLGNDRDSVLYSRSISHLDISNCKISSITFAESFMFMLNLTTLILSGNPLITVDNFVSNTLKYLDLSCCLLGFEVKGIGEQLFTNSPNVQFLNLSRNTHLNMVPTHDLLSYSLKYLDLSYCAFENFNFNSTPNLNEGILKGNFIKTLNRKPLPHDTNLQFLDLSENSIHVIDQNAFIGFKNLRKLDLSKNILTVVDWNFILETPKLNILNVSRNFITSLEDLPAPSLIVMDASKCEISKLNPNFLNKAPNIQFLNLSHNYLEEIPAALIKSNLISLDLSFCLITNFEKDSYPNTSNIAHLNLMGNRISSPFKKHPLDSLLKITDLNLLNNPWHCECSDPDFIRLWKYISLHSQQSNQTKNLLCQSPKQFNGLTWEASCLINLTNSNNTSKNRVILSLLITLFVTASFVGIVIVLRQTYLAYELESQQPDFQRTSHSDHQEYPSITITPNDNLRSGSLTSHTECSQSTSIRELSKLPSYEEALLLPKPKSRGDLQNIVTRYEQNERFNISLYDESQPAAQRGSARPLSDETRPVAQREHSRPLSDDESQPAAQRGSARPLSDETRPVAQREHSSPLSDDESQLAANRELLRILNDESRLEAQREHLRPLSDESHPAVQRIHTRSLSVSYNH